MITAYNFDILLSEMMPVPLALVKLDGSLNSGDKALLQKD